MRQFKPVRNLAHLAGLAFVRPFPDLGANAIQRLFGLLSIQRALPDNDHIPARVAPGLFVADVALDVLRPLLHPELDIGLRHGRILASVPVPETTAHVDYRLGARNDDIGPPGEALVAHPVPPTARKQALAHDHLRQGVPAANLRHQPAALLFCYAIHMQSPISDQDQAELQFTLRGFAYTAWQFRQSKPYTHLHSYCSYFIILSTCTFQKPWLLEQIINLRTGFSNMVRIKLYAECLERRFAHRTFFLKASEPPSLYSQLYLQKSTIPEAAILKKPERSTDGIPIIT